MVMMKKGRPIFFSPGDGGSRVFHPVASSIIFTLNIGYSYLQAGISARHLKSKALAGGFTESAPRIVPVMNVSGNKLQKSC